MTQTRPTRADLMAQHAQARSRRDAAPLDGPEYRAACEDVARIEVAIAAAEEPAPHAPGSSAPGGSTVAAAR
jgi:hypothetical protein